MHQFKPFVLWGAGIVGAVSGLLGELLIPQLSAEMRQQSVGFLDSPVALIVQTVLFPAIACGMMWVVAYVSLRDRFLAWGYPLMAWGMVGCAIGMFVALPVVALAGNRERSFWQQGLVAFGYLCAGVFGIIMTRRLLGKPEAAKVFFKPTFLGRDVPFLPGDDDTLERFRRVARWWTRGAIVLGCAAGLAATPTWAAFFATLFERLGVPATLALATLPFWLVPVNVAVVGRLATSREGPMYARCFALYTLSAAVALPLGMLLQNVLGFDVEYAIFRLIAAVSALGAGLVSLWLTRAIPAYRDVARIW